MVYVLTLFSLLLVGCESQHVNVRSEPLAPQPTPVRPDIDLFEVGPMTRDLPEPTRGDWLFEHKEPGQTFLQFSESKKRRVPDEKRSVIYLRPIGEQVEWGPTTEELTQFVETFFQMPVKMLDPISTDKLTSRKHGPWGTQLLTTSILERLERDLPGDAFCVLGFTLHDLNPADEWNFVFGEATFERRVGVFSFIRHVPVDPGEPVEGEDRNEMLLQSFKVLSHEIGHMFGIRHCIAHHCGMNGINNMTESRNAPLNFGPVCQKKLHSAIGYDVLERNDQLAELLSPINERAGSYYSRRNAWLRERMEPVKTAPK